MEFYLYLKGAYVWRMEGTLCVCVCVLQSTVALQTLIPTVWFELGPSQGQRTLLQPATF